MKRLMIILFVLLCLPLSFLFGPADAQASAKKTPVTSLTTIPADPKGDNGWYTSVTLIELEASKTTKIYVQWNATDGEWKLYKGRIRAWQGENTLYYYSVNKGVAEPIQSRIIKVDYQRPVVEAVNAISNDGTVRLNWAATTDSTAFKIYKKDGGQYRAIAKTNQDSFVDQSVSSGKLYIYAVKAIDGAGWHSDKTTTQILASAAIAPTPKKIIPKVAGGSNVLPSTKTVAQVVREEVKPADTDTVNEPTPIAQPQEVPSKNWNRLLVAISILVIATGAAIGGYYGYEWWTSRSQEEEKPKKKNSRW